MHHPLANFPQSMCAKNYEKLFRVDKVITTNTMYGFLGPPCMCRPFSVQGHATKSKLHCQFVITAFCRIQYTNIQQHGHLFSGLERVTVKGTYNSLDPVHSARTKPDKISRFLNEPIQRYVVLIQIIHVRPPRTFQVIDVISAINKLIHKTSQY